MDSTDESNVALFHPHPHACALLGFLYATKDGRIRAFRFDRSGVASVFSANSGVGGLDSRRIAAPGVG